MKLRILFISYAYCSLLACGGSSANEAEAPERNEEVIVIEESVSPSCGNGTLDGDEECDDGNESNDDACLSNCRAAECGDGTLQVGVEECDDGNDIDEDDCSNDCKRTQFFVGQGSLSVGGSVDVPELLIPSAIFREDTFGIQTEGTEEDLCRTRIIDSASGCEKVIFSDLCDINDYPEISGGTVEFRLPGDTVSLNPNEIGVYPFDNLETGPLAAGAELFVSSEGSAKVPAFSLSVLAPRSMQELSIPAAVSRTESTSLTWQAPTGESSESVRVSITARNINDETVGVSCRAPLQAGTVAFPPTLLDDLNVSSDTVLLVLIENETMEDLPTVEGEGLFRFRFSAQTIVVAEDIELL